MTADRKRFSDDEKARIDQGIERVFTFVQDVLDDPSVLDRLPERAELELTPIETAQDDQRYEAHTQHFAISVKHGSPTQKTRSA